MACSASLYAALTPRTGARPPVPTSGSRGRAGQHAALYRQAVSFIDTLQRRGAEMASPEYVPYNIAFDVGTINVNPDTSSSSRMILRNAASSSFP